MERDSLSELKILKRLNLTDPLKKIELSKIMDVTNKFITQNLMFIQNQLKEDETIVRYHEEKNRIMNDKINLHEIIHRQNKLIEKKKINIMRKFQLMKFTLNNKMILDEIMKSESMKNHIINSESNISNKDNFFVTSDTHNKFNQNLPLKKKGKLSEINIKYKTNIHLANKYNNNILNKTERCITNEKIKSRLMPEFSNKDFKRLKSIKKRNIKKLILLNTNDKSITNINSFWNSSKIKQKKTNISKKDMITSRNKSMV